MEGCRLFRKDRLGRQEGGITLSVDDWLGEYGTLPVVD